MKILTLTKLYSPWIGGVEKVAEQVSSELNKKKGFEVKVLCCRDKGKQEIERIKKVEVFRASSWGIFWGMPFSFDLFRKLRKLSSWADIIDFHHPFPLGDLALLLFNPRAKLIVHYHSDIVRQKALSFLFKPLVLSTLKKASKIIVSNPNLIEGSPYLKKFKEKCRVIPFGIDLDKFETVDLEKQKDLKRKYGDFVLMVGRLNYYKGVKYLIEAQESIKNKLVIIGEGPQKEKLQSMIKEKGLQDKISILSYQDRQDLIDFYHAASVLVLPSIYRSEAFGLVLIEAMACGTPVISTELQTGTSWVNLDGETGLVVPPKDSSSLRKAIQKIIENEKLAYEFGQKAKQRVKDKFNLKRMLEETAQVCKEL